MPHSNYERAEKVFFHDKLLANTILKIFPKFVKPNHITIFRLLTTPGVVFLMLYNNYSVGLVAFLIVAFTDALDGSMARTRNQITEWGRIYDPVADKLLIGSMVFVIVLRYIDFWSSIIIISMEIIFIIAAWIYKMKGMRVEANVWGKIKMCLQVAGVSILLLSIIFNWGALLPLASGTLYLAIAFAVISLFSYGI